MSDVFPFVRYEDAPAAMEWLAKAFGFEEKVRYEEGGRIEHAEMSFGDGVVMIGSTREDEVRVRTPKELGGITGGIYIAVNDIEALYERAKGAGAEIVRELSDTDYGSRDFIALDPEGHLWSFGTYRPE